MTTGELALIGGREWTDGCTFDADLLAASGGSSVLVLATAAAYENPGKVLARAQSWFAGLGATVTTLPVFGRADALLAEPAERAREARFIYLADGAAQHLRSVLYDTVLLEAIVAAWQSGAVLAAAGYSATALCEHMVDARGGAYTVGLDVLLGYTVLPHADEWSPDKARRTIRLANSGLVVAAVPTRTALRRSAEGAWSVAGAGPVHLSRGGQPVALDALAGL
jgi:cyanophycinase